MIGILSVMLGGAIGVALGLVAGYAGGWIDSLIMRVADVQLTFPAILIALLLDGVAHAILQKPNREETAFLVLVVAIGLSFWVQYARTVRGSTLVEKNRDYVQAARLIGLSPARIVVRHILPECHGAGAGDRDDQPRDRHHHRSERSPSSASAFRRLSPRSEH